MYDSSIHSQRVAMARTTAREKLALLYHKGKEVYAHDQHRERYDAIVGEFRNAINSVLADAEETAAKHRATINRLDSLTSLDRLTPEEIDQANRLSAFTSEDVRSLTISKLQQRVQAALDSNNRVQAFLLSRYVGQRVESEREALGGRPDELVTELAGLVRNLESSLIDPKEQAEKAAAQAGIKKAAELRREVGQAKLEILGDGGTAAALAATGAYAAY
jgi:hypothetical protein